MLASYEMIKRQEERKKGRNSLYGWSRHSVHLPIIFWIKTGLVVFWLEWELERMSASTSTTTRLQQDPGGEGAKRYCRQKEKLCTGGAILWPSWTPWNHLEFLQNQNPQVRSNEGRESFPCNTISRLRDWRLHTVICIPQFFPRFFGKEGRGAKEGWGGGEWRWEIFQRFSYFFAEWV